VPALSSDPHDSKPDQRLVAAFLDRRDERTFVDLYRRHTPALLALARRLLGGAGSGAEDAVQEMWLRAAKGLAGFRWESSLRTWLAGIVIRCCREAIRTRRPGTFVEPVDTLEEPAAATTASDGARTAAVRIDLERALRELPDGYREVLVLHDLEGYTHEEIATQLEIQVGTSKSQLSKARRAIRALLDSSGDTDEATA
jgi:RNA polymerase sigma-70 factor (ECF subfamily)